MEDNIKIKHVAILGYGGIGIAAEMAANCLKRDDVDIVVLTDGNVITNRSDIELSDEQIQQIRASSPVKESMVYKIECLEPLQEIIPIPKSNSQPWKKRKKGCSGYGNMF